MTSAVLMSTAAEFPIVFGSIGQKIFGTLMFLSALFLILLVLVQRGRGGGLSGAFGGMGGQSAFGAKAGDTFTWITVWTAAIWIVLCICAIKFLDSDGNAFAGAGGATANMERALGLEDIDGEAANSAADATEPAASSGEAATDSASADGAVEPETNSDE